MRPRTKTWPAVAALLLALALALAAPAAAQQAPTLGAPSTQETTTQAPVTTTDTSDGGLATWQQALIFAAGFILLGGIAIAIVSDARQRAGGDDRAVTEGAGAPGHRHRQQAKQRARAKARAAKAQRRRNR